MGIFMTLNVNWSSVR